MKPTNDKTMEAIRLISMTDFVLEIDKEWENPSKPFSENKALMKICKYATFLKQSLQLGFFVPCDENGNVLDPSDAFRSCEKGFVYSKAKERVLFKGLENYYKDQLERTGKFKVVAIEDYNKLQILLNHKPNPDYQSDPFPGQLG